jgi:small-conductance mechanosensitive channel/CRP-like cAMP-binding protein
MGGFPQHVILGITAIAVILGIISVTPNRLIRRRLRLSIVLLVAYLAIDATLRLYGLRHFSTETQSELTAFDKLALAAAFINAFVFVLVNPLRADRVPERFPIILQDFIVLALILLSSTFLSQQLLTTSAVSAVVLGFALQDTLGNAFAGLAIQSEKPFHVGQWIKIGENEGRVAEVTWRATKLRTKNGNFAVIPNNIIAKEVITNFSEPAAPTGMTVDVGASYLAPPNQVKAVMLEAMRHSSYLLAAPAPEVLTWSFEASAITYRARFWIENYENDERARDEVRRAIYYGFQRHGIEIPFPIQVQYEKEWREPDPSKRIEDIERLLTSVDLFVSLAADVRHEVAVASPTTVYGSGETIVRQGEDGQSMFVVMSGSVSVVLEPAREEVAKIHAGGYFGEMSLLTGEPRSATVRAVGDVVVVEISADLFRRIGAVHPDAIEKIGVAAMVRRAGLEKVKTATAVTVAVETANLLTRMKRFLGLA